MLETLESLCLKIFLRWPFFMKKSADRSKLYRDIPPSPTYRHSTTVSFKNLQSSFIITNRVTRKLIIMIS